MLGGGLFAHRGRAPARGAALGGDRLGEIPVEARLAQVERVGVLAFGLSRFLLGRLLLAADFIDELLEAAAQVGIAEDVVRRLAVARGPPVAARSGFAGHGQDFTFSSITRIP